jgi:hypothetical protein
MAIFTSPHGIHCLVCRPGFHLVHPSPTHLPPTHPYCRVPFFLSQRNGDLKHIAELKYWGLDQVLQEKYNFEKEDAVQIQDFLTKCLQYSTSRRATARQCMEHEWMKEPLQRHKEMGERRRQMGARLYPRRPPGPALGTPPPPPGGAGGPGGGLFDESYDDSDSQLEQQHLTYGEEGEDGAEDGAAGAHYPHITGAGVGAEAERDWSPCSSERLDDSAELERHMLGLYGGQGGGEDGHGGGLQQEDGRFERFDDRYDDEEGGDAEEGLYGEGEGQVEDLQDGDLEASEEGGEGGDAGTPSPLTGEGEDGVDVGDIDAVLIEDA